MQLTPAGPVVTNARLARATLDRQLLLDRADLDVTSAVRAVLALQAQELVSAYVALWARLRDLRPERVDAAFADRALVKASLLRLTLHVVAAADYPMVWSAMQPTLRTLRLGQVRGALPPEARPTPDDPWLDALIAVAVEHAATPRSNAELAEALAAYVDGRTTAPPGRDWWWVLRGTAPIVHVPTTAGPRAPWSYPRRPAYVAARAWIGDPGPGDPIDHDQAVDALVARYLQAYGPATVADVAQFTKISRARVRGAVARLADTLQTYTSEGGTELLDLAGATLPEADVPAPARLLPMWDSLLLAHADRSRFIPPEHRQRIIRVNGDLLPTVLVDGRVAGIWRTEPTASGARVRWHTFEPVPRRVRAELDAEAASLEAFLAEREPAAYARYSRWWPTAMGTQDAPSGTTGRVETTRARSSP